MRLTLRKLLHMHQAQHLRHARGDFGFRQFVLLQAEGDVLLDGHVREQGIGLEHHVDGPLVRRHAGEVYPIQHDLPGGGLFKPGQHAQQGRFTAAGCAEQSKNFTFVDRQADIVHGVLSGIDQHWCKRTVRVRIAGRRERLPGLRDLSAR